MNQSTSKTVNAANMCRRLAALLATLALLASMTLPVYAEALENAATAGDTQTTASEVVAEEPAASEDNSTPDTTGAGETANDETDTTEDDNSGDTDETPADDVTTPDTPAEDDAKSDADDVDDNDASDAADTITPEDSTDTTEQDSEEAEDDSLTDTPATQASENSFVVYFAVPSDWGNGNYSVYFKGQKGNTGSGGKMWVNKEMSLLAKQTDDGRNVFSVELSTPAAGVNPSDKEAANIDCPWGIYYSIIFYKIENGQTTEFNCVSNKETPRKTFEGKMFDAQNKTWGEYTPFDATKHTTFAGKTMAFENRTSETLANVVAHFYEPNADGRLEEVEGSGIHSDVEANKKVEFTIPTAACSYVRFTTGDGTAISKYYNFYGQAVEGGDKESFLYLASRMYAYIYKGSDTALWGIPGTTRVYYDATFSKLATTGTNDTDGNYSIPKEGQSAVYYCIRKNDQTTTDGTMTRVEGTDYYAVDVPEGYTEIVFSAYPLKDSNDLATCGDSTGWEQIHTEFAQPCFYADTNDDAVYRMGTRGGYWAEKDTFRDAAKGKGSKVVDLTEKTFTANAKTKYITSTLYDYYSDYELNGKNRNTYSGANGRSHRNWITFREFDQALSDYYRASSECANIKFPIYTGHFQPSGMDTPFDQVQSKLNLFGWNNYKTFIAANNSNYDVNSNGGKYACAFQGIVANELDADGDPVMNDTSLKEPHFNEEFLTETNSKNAKLGEVYHDVSFPFTQNVIFADEPGVNYWWYDSAQTSLYLRKDGSKLYLGNDSQKETTAGWTSANSKNVNSSSGTSDVSTTYGFFPFNEKTTSEYAAKYNYGYGAKLEIPFTLTSDGTVEAEDDTTKEKSQVPIRFYFSGDDDVWVFIDGKLALDVGGAHGKVSGILDFNQSESGGHPGKVRAYVSDVKDNGLQQENGGYTTGNTTKIKYLGQNEVTYKYSKDVAIENLTTGQHTLMLYYMERGMWESNMAVAFNFPDHNELEVEKKVDTTAVNDELFKAFYTDADNTQFTFNIKNLATHYGPVATAGSPIPSQALTASNYTAKSAWPSNTCQITEAPDKTNDVVKWYAKSTDTTSDWRHRRYGILTLKDTVDISNKQYLSFYLYCNDKTTTGYAADRIYLQLLDSNGQPLESDKTKQYIGSAAYGNVSLTTGKWCKVTVYVDKVAASGIDRSKIKYIRFGCDYDRTIYWKDFTFTGTVASTENIGFIKKQSDIPDYGSVVEGTLQNATGALYTSNARTGNFAVDTDGEFVLKNNETIRFEDQFRRGSYLSITETPNDSYETYWTVYENGSPVTSMGKGKTVANGSVTSLEKQDGNAPDDGRTEHVDGNTQGPYAKNEHKPDASTLVFRSYANPDSGDEGTLTKLKVQFVNKVKVGSLTIKKEGAVDSDAANLNGEYTFNITFSNIGGTGSTQTVTKDVTLKCGDEKTIDGIPLNTDYTITEVLPNDNSRLAEITVNGTPVSGDTAKGTITNTGTAVKVVFKNTKKPLIDLTVEKLWENEQGTDLTDGLPDSIFIQLQRYVPDSDKWEPVPNQDDNRDYVEISPDYATGAWKHTFTTLDKVVDYAKGDMRDWQYRVVEGTVKDGEFTASGNTITFGEGTNQKQFTISSSAAAGQGSEATTTEDGTISGGSGTITLTNKLQDPRFNLKVIKADAENTNTKLKDVEFKLEKLITGTDGSLIVDTAFSPIMGTTNVNGILLVTKDGKSVEGFTELEAGIYQLTEIKAADGYNLLSGPIQIEFTKDHKCKLNGTLTDSNFSDNENGSYTLTLTVLNRKVPELPHTGADAPSLWLLIGLPLAVAGLLVLVFRYNKKGGRTK